MEFKSTKRMNQRVSELADKGLTPMHVKHVALSRGIQPLQARAHPMWQYTKEKDPARVIREGFFKN